MRSRERETPPSVPLSRQGHETGPGYARTAQRTLEELSLGRLNICLDFAHDHHRVADHGGIACAAARHANLYDMTDALRSHQAGDTVVIVTKRDGLERRATAVLGKRE